MDVWRDGGHNDDRARLAAERIDGAIPRIIKRLLKLGVINIALSENLRPRSTTPDFGSVRASAR